VVETRAESRSPPGGGVFEDHCAKCHAEDAIGRAKRPSLRSDRAQRATDGEIFWLWRNGNLPKGTPTRAALAEPMRWQIISCIKSLGPATPAAPFAADTKPN